MPNFFPLQLLLATFAGWVNREQAQIASYLVEENRVLREQLGDRRLRLTDDQRRRLAAKGKVLGWRLLHKIATIVTPDTIMRWHRRLIAAKWTYTTTRVGRPGIMKAIRKLIVRMATDNAGWGYCRIRGEAQEARPPRRPVDDRQDAEGAMASVQRQNGRLRGARSLRSHADVIAADRLLHGRRCGRPVGSITHYVLFVIHHAMRAVHIAGITTNPDGSFMAQIARNLSRCVRRVPSRASAS